MSQTILPSGNETVIVVGQDWSYTPFVVWRRANLPFAELLPLALPQTWDLLQELQDAFEKEKSGNGRLVDTLHQTIPRIPADERRWLLSLKRDVFNRRLPKGPDVEVARRHLCEDMLSLLDEVLTACKEKEALLLKAGAMLEGEMRQAFETLRRLAASDDFVRGIQLSGKSLRQNVRAFSALNGQSNVPPGLRKTRETIISYVSRMALKPSPFGAFTEVGANSWMNDSTSASQAEGPRRSSVSHLSRAVLSWIQALMLELPEYKETFPLWLNNTVEEQEGRIEFFIRGLDQGEQVFGGEKLVSCRATPPLKAVIAELRSQKLNRKQLLEQLAKIGINPENGTAFVEKLIMLGLVERGFGFPDQSCRYLRRMIELLAEIPGERSSQCISILTQVAQIEDKFSGASVEEREKMLNEMDAHFRNLAFHLGSEQYPDSESMANLFEDYGSLAPSQSWQPSLLENERVRFTLLAGLLPIFDDACIERAGLYEYYDSQYGCGKEIDFLNFYHAFSALGSDRISTIMRGMNSPYVAAVQEFRTKLWTGLTQRLNEQADASVLNLDDDYVRELVQQCPVSQVWESASLRVQFAVGDRGCQMVLNGIGPGYTSRFSRFCDVLGQGAGTSGALTDWMRNHFRSSPEFKRRTDLSAVLNINTNLHPPIACIELEYPRCRANENVEVLTLRDLYVAPAPNRKELRLYRKKDRMQIAFVPLNFLHPVAGPPLYRFLYLFGPFVNYRHGLWKYYRAAHAPQSERVHYPRLIFGPIVLDRRTWVHDVKQMKRIDLDVDKISAASLLAVDEWRRHLGLPRECFFSLNPGDGTGKQPANWTEAVLEWTRRVKEMRRRKPHYVDFHNPFQSAILFKGLCRMSSGTASFQECLPATADYLGGVGQRSAEEFLIELNRWPAR